MTYINGISNINTIDLAEKYLYMQGADNFFAFRRIINPKAKVGWFYKEITEYLQAFYYDYKEGKCPQLIIQAPPQHGKSEAVTDFMAWVFGKERELRIIYASFSETLGYRANTRLQRIMSSKAYIKIFGDVLNINKTTKSIKQKNKSLIENAFGRGYFRNTTVAGSITGESLDLGVIDDPVKGREAAESITIREKTQDWYLNDFLTRFDEKGAFLMILTRWHIDDLAGFIQKISPDVKVLSYAAIAEKDEKHRKAGQALFPEFKSLEFLEKRKKQLGTRDFESLYQQKPIMGAGNLINTNWIHTTNIRIDLNKFEKVFITADTAQKTKEINDWTVYSVWGVYESKLYMLAMVRDKVTSIKRETLARALYAGFESARRFEGFYIEQKASGIDLFQRMKEGDRDKGYKPLIVREVERDTDKVSRCMDILAYMETYGLYIYDDIMQIEAIYAEAAQFPVGEHDDIMDTVFDAYNIAYKQTVLNYGEILKDWDNFKG